MNRTPAEYSPVPVCFRLLPALRAVAVSLCGLVAPGLHATALALNSPEQEVVVRTLSAAEILDLTEDKTWVIDFDNSTVTSTTFYKAGGERFTERDGLVERLQWFIDEQADQRCVRSAFGSRCGYIVSFGGALKICMQLDPLGDCSYTVARIENGDRYGLEQRSGL
ncbi:MAG: hypothetical protein CMF26_00325 [Kiloniella sp.]|nr:hypothetical protein [Kiloniella sp.]